MKISSTEIKSLIPEGLKLIFDHEFTIPEHSYVVITIEQYISDRGPLSGSEEKDDCDNRAFKMFTALMGEGWDFAFISIPGHAVCGYIDRQKQWRYFEPLDGAEIDQPIKHVVTIMA